jgi:hypothetical protein
MVCKKGTLSKGGCVETHIASPKPVCPKHTKFDGKGNCLSKDKTKPVKVCEKGYELSKKGHCETQVLVQAMPTKKGVEVDFKCHGHTDEKGNCYQSHKTEAALVCEKGYELDGKHCISYVSLPSELECPKGFETASVGTKADCVKTKVHKPKCPKGFKESKGQCIKTHKSKAAKVCPKGTDGHKKCVEVVEAEPEMVCPKGFEATKGGCMKPGYAVPGNRKVYEPKFKCPHGFKLDKKAMVCRDSSKVQPMVVCEKGYELHGKKCVATHTIAPIAMCPKGFVGGKDGKGCSRVTYERPHFKCPKGAQDHGKKCFTWGENVPFEAPMPAPKKGTPAPTKH